MSDSWYYARGGQSQGPVTWAQLQQFAASGGLAATDMVWTEGMAAWLPASQIPNLGLPAQTQNAYYAPPQTQQPPPGLNYQSPMPPQQFAPQYVNPQDAEMTGFDWVLAVLCSGIGCIVGIVYLCTGKPKGGKMLGMSILFIVIWNIISFAVRMGMQR